MPSIPKYRLRAAAAFKRNVQEAALEINAMMADHAAKGALQSGGTIKAALRIYEEQSRKALDQSLAEAAKLIDHRGRSWTAALNGIRELLDEHLAAARQHLEKPIKVADPRKSPSVSGAVDGRLSEIGTRLHDRFSEFQEGWTAPVPKLWKDRHPLFYAVLLLMIGAGVGLVVPVAKELVKSQAPANPQQTDVGVDDRLTYPPGEKRPSTEHEWRGGVLGSSRDRGAAAVAPNAKGPPNTKNEANKAE